MASFTAVIREAYVDWLTVTTKSKKKTDAFVNNGKVLAEMEHRAGNVPTVFTSHGYTGGHCGRVSWGVRDEEGILQLSSNLASAYFDSVMRLGGKVTRLDIQVTARIEPESQYLAENAYNARPASLPGRGRVPRYTIYSDSAGGATLYIGRGASVQMGRMYNKAAESKEPEYAKCWRWELQLRKELADTAGKLLATQRDQPGWITDYVYAWFADRGVTPLFTTRSEFALLTPPKPTTDLERKLGWLRNAVRPTVALLAYYERLPEALSALGLDASLDVTSLPDFDMADEDGPTTETEIGDESV